MRRTKERNRPRKLTSIAFHLKEKIASKFPSFPIEIFQFILVDWFIQIKICHDDEHRENKRKNQREKMKNWASMARSSYRSSNFRN
jgi:hypothetical protein